MQMAQPQRLLFVIVMNLDYQLHQMKLNEFFEYVQLDVEELLEHQDVPIEVFDSKQLYCLLPMIVMMMMILQ